MERPEAAKPKPILASRTCACVRACDCQSAKGNACGCVTGFEREEGREAREHRTHNARQSKGMEGYQLAGTLDDAGGASLG